jgi:hypothetical protein
MGTEITNDYEIVLKCLTTNKVRSIKRKLIEEHVNNLEKKFNDGTIENNYKIIGLFRAIETYEV